MDMIAALLVPSLLGGTILAVSLWIAHRRSCLDALVRPPHVDAILVDPINMAHIRVDGVGGLGMVAMALVVAFSVPAIGFSLAIALGAGCLVGLGLVVFRRVH